MVLSDALRYADLFEGLQEAEAALGASRVAAGPRIFVIGSEDALG
jgi:hypothetical protein